MQESSEQEERFCRLERLRSLALWEATYLAAINYEHLDPVRGESYSPIDCPQVVSSKTVRGNS
jgi:hypothetical protein